MTNCTHEHLRRQADTPFTPFPSFNEGWRWYHCPECGTMFKSKNGSDFIVSSPYVVTSEAAAQPTHEGGCMCWFCAKHREIEHNTTNQPLCVTKKENE